MLNCVNSRALPLCDRVRICLEAKARLDNRLNFYVDGIFSQEKLDSLEDDFDASRFMVILYPDVVDREDAIALLTFLLSEIEGSEGDWMDPFLREMLGWVRHKAPLEMDA